MSRNFHVVAGVALAFLLSCTDDGGSSSPASTALESSKEVTLLVGAGAKVITPPDPVGFVMAGYGGVITGGPLTGSMRYATGVHDDVWARSVAITRPSSGKTILLQSLDLAGCSQIDINPVKRRIERDLGIPVGNITIASTHNHMGPDAFGIWAGTIDYVYQAWMREQMFLSAKEAFESRVPVRMKSCTAEPPSGYDPVTLEIKTSPDLSFPDSWDEVRALLPGYDVEMIQTDLREPYVRNTKVVTMLFENLQTGKTVASLVNWHDHPEVLTSGWTEISSDFPHYIRERMESLLGGTCVYFSGTVGCQIGALRSTKIPERDETGAPVFDPAVFDAQGNPFPKFATEKIARIRSLGYIVADTTVAGLAGSDWTPDPALEMVTEPLDVDIPNLLLQGVVWLGLKRLDREPEDGPVFGPHITSEIGGMRTEMSVITVGDCQIMTAPGEFSPEYMVGRGSSTTDYGEDGTWFFPSMIAVENHMTGRDKMMFSLANDYFGYAIPASDHVGFFNVSHPNHYEEFVTPGEDFGDSVGNKMLQMLGEERRFSDYPINP